jgi:hypothetical protein
MTTENQKGCMGIKKPKTGSFAGIYPDGKNSFAEAFLLHGRLCCIFPLTSDNWGHYTNIEVHITGCIGP